MTQVYLTIDDSMSSRSHELIDYLVMNGIPAILYCRGDMLEAFPDQADYAVGKGMVLANHSYAHRPSGALSFEEWQADFERTERLIEKTYARAGKSRPGYYFRFPYLDRGDGDRVEQRFPQLIESVRQGMRADLSSTEKMVQIQAYLRLKGFTQPFKQIEHPLYQIPSIRDAGDCLMTYSSCDWMLLERHRERDWPYKSLEDLKQAMSDDPYLFKGTGRQIVLFHDNAEIIDATIALVDYMKNCGVEFVPV